MVATKSKKYTYAERVLRAFSQVQKEHKRHAIHLATLRAQVRKSAQERKDKLGPKWSSWVGRAVHKLEFEGVLAALEPVGNISLTPDGKRAIQTARRSLSIAPHASPSLAEEDSIWKHVTQQFAGRGLKRKQPSRRISSGVAHQEVDEEDSDEEEEVLSSLKKHTRAKRPRISTSPKKMTKAEIWAELKSLQRKHVETVSDLRQASQPEAGSEEIRLREELRLRQEEVDAIRHELAKVRRVDDTEGLPDDASSRLTTPQPTPEPITDITELSTPTQRNLPNAASCSRPLMPMMRTQSGSMISEISKQPTPAPSSPDAEHANYDPFLDTGMHDDVGFSFDPNQATAARPPVVNNEVELTKEVEKYKYLLEDVRRKAEDSRMTLQDKVEKLETALRSHSVELENHSSRSEVSNRITVMVSEIETLKRVETEKDDAISLRDAEIQKMRADKANLEETLVSKDKRLHEFEGAVLEHESAISELKAEKDKFTAQVSSLQQCLYDSNAAIKEHLAIIDSGTEGQSVVERCFEKSTDIQVAAHFSTMMLQLKRTGEKVVAQRTITVKELAELNTRIAAIVEELQSVRHQADVSSAEAQASVKVMSEQLAVSDEALQETRIANEGLKELLSRSQKDEEDLRARVTSLESSVRLLTEELEKSMATTKQLRVEQAKIASELQEKEKTIANLTESKTQSMSKISALSTQLQNAKESVVNLERERDMSCATLTRIESERDHIRLDLTAIQEERQQLTEKLSITEVIRDCLSTEVRDKQRDIQDLEATLESLEIKAKNLASTLEASEAQKRATVIDYDTKLSALKNNMASMQNEVDRLQSEVLDASAETRKTESQLGESRAECDRIQEILEAERLRAIELGKEHEDALGRVRDAREDIQELRMSKEVDQETIEGLKDSFAKLRKAQMAALAELETGVASAKSSPVPKSRGSSHVWAQRL